MRNWRARGTGAWAVTIAVALAIVGGSLALGQNPAAKGKAAAKAGKGQVKGNVVPKKPHVDPLANPALQKGALLPGTFHYKFKINAFDNTPLSAVYYPARLGTTAPVILMIHEKDRTTKDFEDPITELKGQGLAEHMQGQGYAVLLLNLRNQGLEQRRPLETKDWRMMVDDLQAAYTFLLDRHNRGELNLVKLGVLAVGEGANLAAAWASMPGGAVASEGRTSDLAAMVLVSPMADGEGFPLGKVLASIAPRFPLMILAGGRDPISADPVKTVRAIVERLRLNKVEIFPSTLHGYKLLRLEPKATSILARFFEGTIKFKAIEWEPRYNLTPVTYSEIQIVRNAKPPTDPLAPKAKEKAKEAEKKDAAAPKEKAKEAEK